VDWHTLQKDDGGRSRYCPLALLVAIPLKQLPLTPEKFEVVIEVNFQVFCSHELIPSNRENLFVPLAGRGPLMNVSTFCLLSVSKVH